MRWEENTCFHIWFLEGKTFVEKNSNSAEHCFVSYKLENEEIIKIIKFSNLVQIIIFILSTLLLIYFPFFLCVLFLLCYKHVKSKM